MRAQPHGIEYPQFVADRFDKLMELRDHINALTPDNALTVYEFLETMTIDDWNAAEYMGLAPAQRRQIEDKVIELTTAQASRDKDFVAFMEAIWQEDEDNGV